MKRKKRSLLVIGIIIGSITLSSGAMYVAHEISKAKEEARLQEEAEQNPMLANANISALENATLVPNDDLQAYITSLFKNGESQTKADMQALLDIVSFWEDTNDDREIIGSIYAKRPYAEKLVTFSMNRGWIESAYNEMTGRTDILSTEDIKTYLDAGLTIDDILAANRLSLRGKITTEQALTRIKNGETWYGVITGVTPASTELASIPSHEILDAVSISIIQGKQVDAILLSDNTADDTIRSETSVEGSETE